MCQCTLFDVGGVEIHSIECIEYCVLKSMSEMSEIYQIHLIFVMLFMSETSEIVIIFNIHGMAEKA